MSGVPYKYGGNNPISGFDCSGYVSDILKASGVIHYNVDLSAQNLYDMFRTPKLGSILSHPQAGAISFYGSNHHVTHVAFCVSNTMMLEAGGGDESVISKEEAILRGAYVKLRPINYRKDFFVSILPNY